MKLWKTGFTPHHTTYILTIYSTSPSISSHKHIHHISSNTYSVAAKYKLISNDNHDTPTTFLNTVLPICHFFNHGQGWTQPYNKHIWMLLQLNSLACIRLTTAYISIDVVVGEQKVSLPLCDKIVRRVPFL